jgi:hypothetical protein
MIDYLFVSLIIIASIAFAVVGTLIVRKKFGHEHLSRHNEIAGFIYAVIGVVYAVLVAFVVIVVWENHQEAHEIVEHEANSISAIQALSDGFNDDYNNQLNAALNDYLKQTVNVDWELMKTGESLKKVKEKPSDASFAGLRDLIYSYQPISPKEELLLDKLVDKLEELAENRRMRFFSSKLSVPGFMWFVLLIGAFWLVVFAMLFSSANLWAQLVMISILAASISLVLILVYSMNHPYYGIINVEPDSLINLISSK